MGQEDSIARQLIQNETTNRLVHLTDVEVAKQIGMEEGKYYCFYNPSLVNREINEPESPLRVKHIGEVHPSEDEEEEDE